MKGSGIMVDFNAPDGKTYFVTHTQGIKQFHKLEATADGIRLLVCGDSAVEALRYDDIGYIITESKPEYFSVADNFISFIKSDLADAPTLFDFMLAICNEDYGRADEISSADDSITSKFISYMQNLVKTQECTALLSAVFVNYLRYKNKEPT